jgi:stress response protein YsnF
MAFQYRQSIVALFETRRQAESAREDLIRDCGIAAGDIRISDQASRQTTGTAASAPTPTRDDIKREEPGFFAWLFGDDGTSSRYYGGYDYDRGRYGDTYARHDEFYRESVSSRGRTILTVVSIDDEREYYRISDILERHNPIDLDTEGGEHIAGYHHHEWGRDQALGTTSGQAGEAGEQRIPLAKEELHVGKRQVRRAKAYRIRTHVEEVPVEEQVQLRDEKVTVERQPHHGRTPAGDSFRQRTVEMHEMHEEPVVEKSIRAQEDVVIKKDVNTRTETVRDKVRETKVDVQREAAGSKPGTGE